VHAQRIAALADVLRAREFVGICDEYAENWGLVDRELRHICTERCIGHGTFAAAYPKVVIIDEAYNAGLARSIRNPSLRGFNAQRAVANWMCGEGREAIDGAVFAQRTSFETTEDWLAACLAGHGAVAKGLSTLGGKVSWPTSFVAKYLHFHNADYVIYDSVVDERLRNLLAEAWDVSTVRCQVLDPKSPFNYSNAYFGYLNRFAFYMDAGESVRPGTTMKELDHFLWNRPGL